MKTLVIIPTYNEKENISNIVEQVLKKGVSLLVIDDNSPDGTGQALEGLRSRHTGLHVMHRTGKLGLGTAYIQGFKWALDRGYDFVFTMDADFSHNPEYIPEFINKLAVCGLVVGSRYVSGGGVKNWPLHRKFISRFGNFYAKTILQHGINDSTSGFMGFRMEVLKKIDINDVKSEGYGFLIEMKYRAYKKGFKICEHPIIFVDRTLGSSKISKTIIWEAIFLVWKLKIKIR